MNKCKECIDKQRQIDALENKLQIYQEQFGTNSENNQRIESFKKIFGLTTQLAKLLNVFYSKPDHHYQYYFLCDQIRISPTKEFTINDLNLIKVCVSKLKIILRKSSDIVFIPRGSNSYYLTQEGYEFIKNILDKEII